MSTQPTLKNEADYQTLQEELEQRYGPALAQQIIDQIKQADKPNSKPHFVTVKALSEATEIFRADARNIIKDLKETEPDDQNAASVVYIDVERQKRELERILNLYFLCQKRFYRFYHKAMAAVIEETPDYQYIKRKTSEPEQARAA